MLNRLTNRIYQLTRWQWISLIFLCLLAFNLWFFPTRTRQFGEYLGYPSLVLDTRLNYTPEQVNEYFADLGESGRSLYAWTEATLDFLYPLLYGAFFSLSIALIGNKVLPSGSSARYLVLLPWLGVLADFMENMAITFMLMSYPSTPPWMVYLTRFFSLIKWGVGFASFFLLIIGLAAWIIRTIRGRSTR